MNADMERALNAVGAIVKAQHPYASNSSIELLVMFLDSRIDEWLAEQQAEWKHPAREAAHPHAQTPRAAKPTRTPPKHNNPEDLIV